MDNNRYHLFSEYISYNLQEIKLKSGPDRIFADLELNPPLLEEKVAD